MASVGKSYKRKLFLKFLAENLFSLFIERGINEFDLRPDCVVKTNNYNKVHVLASLNVFVAEKFINMTE